MHLYKVVPRSKNWGGYDTFDSMVVVAETSDDACQMYPGWVHPHSQSSEPKTWPKEYDSGAWPDSPDKVTALYLGVAAPGLKRGIVCSSFNAG